MPHEQILCISEALLMFHYGAEIGIGLTGLGFLFLFLGVLFFFDKGLIALGNVSTVFMCIGLTVCPTKRGD